MTESTATENAATETAATETAATESTTRAKSRGRLDRAVLATLGKGLEECFDEIRKQGVPERFKLLLQQF